MCSLAITKRCMISPLGGRWNVPWPSVRKPTLQEDRKGLQRTARGLESSKKQAARSRLEGILLGAGEHRRRVVGLLQLRHLYWSDWQALLGLLRSLPCRRRKIASPQSADDCAAEAVHLPLPLPLHPISCAPNRSRTPAASQTFLVPAALCCALPSLCRLCSLSTRTRKRPLPFDTLRRPSNHRI